MLRMPSGVLAVPPAGATVAVYNVGTSVPISDTIYADDSSSTTLPNPMPTEADGLIDFWTLNERELDVVVSATGYSTVRTTVTTDAAGGGTGGGGGGTGVDVNLRTYVQHIMGVIDPSGPPSPTGP